MAAAFFTQLSYIAKLPANNFIDHTKPSLESDSDNSSTPFTTVVLDTFDKIIKQAKEQGLTDTSTDAESERFLNSYSEYKTDAFFQSCLFRLACTTDNLPVCLVGKLLNQTPELVNKSLITESRTALIWLAKVSPLELKTMGAFSRRILPLVQLLISRGAHINSMCNGSTPLFAVLQTENIPLIKCFLMHGGKVFQEEINVLPKEQRSRPLQLLKAALQEIQTAHCFITHTVKKGVLYKIPTILRLKIWSYLAPEILHVNTAASLL